MNDDQRTGVDIEALTAEIDHRLKDADAALAHVAAVRAGRVPSDPSRADTATATDATAVAGATVRDA